MEQKQRIFRPDLAEIEMLLGELVRRPSPSGQEAEVARFVAGWLQSQGISVTLADVQDGRPNVVGRVTRGGTEQSLLLLGHTDTALPTEGWITDPYVPRRENGRVVGLGAGDMKGGLVSGMLAIRELARRDTWEGTVTLACVVDEEAYSLGMKALLSTLPRHDCAILAEPHHDEVMLGYPGKVLLKVCVQGKAAHGSTPDLGINAISEAARLLSAIEQLPLGSHPLLGKGSQCVLKIQGGPEAYVITVPEHCTFIINRHILPSETGEQVVARVKALAHTLGLRAQVDASIDPPYYPPYIIDPRHPFVSTFASAYRASCGQPPRFGYGRGVCDANYLGGDAGVPTIVYGPRGGNLHAPNEWVDLGSIAEAAAVYVATAEQVLAPG